MLMKKWLIVLLIVIVLVLGIFHRSIISSIHELRIGENFLGPDKGWIDKPDKKWVDNVSVTGTGTCTERKECEEMLGKGAFCSNGKCFPAPADYDENMAECICADGSKIKAVDCRWIDCPGELTAPTEFTIKNGLVSKVTADINFPLSAKEAKKVAIAACGISAQTSEPASPYENIISECSPTWSFFDETNPCNSTRAYVCGNKTFASCTFGEEKTGAVCIEGQPLIQGEYNEKFIVANPLDFSQISEISKFRSCSGHDYSGYNVKGELETQRSMKHYFHSVSGVTSVSHYAPFDGTIIKYFVSPFPTAGYNTEHELWIMGDHSGNWTFMFGHVTLKEGLSVNSKVKAGELIATSIVDVQGDGTEYSLLQDKSTETIKEQFMRGAPLDYMADNVLAEYASYSLTPENVVFTKEYRDAHPCDWSALANSNDWVPLNSN